MNFKNSKNMYYKIILLEWLDYKKDKVKTQSYSKYYYIINNYLIPILGNKKVRKINEKCIDDFFENQIIKGLSLSTKKTLLYVLKSSGHKYLGNVILNIKIKSPKSSIVYFNKEEQKKIENYNTNDLKKIGIIICLYTGIRIGELCCLKWEDIDFENGYLNISKTIQRVKNFNNEIKSKTSLVISSPKSFSSKRIIPLSNYLLNYLKKFKSANQNFILTNSLKPLEPRNYEKYFENILLKLKIRKLKFHALRHTFATRSIESGMDIKTLSEILGHSSYRITYEVYVHSSLDFKRKSLNNLVDYINN